MCEHVICITLEPCEKRIPKHGDENTCDYHCVHVHDYVVKKESPNMGTKGRLVWL